jgi:hypothetical protein
LHALIFGDASFHDLYNTSRPMLPVGICSTVTTPNALPKRNEDRTVLPKSNDTQKATFCTPVIHLPNNNPPFLFSFYDLVTSCPPTFLFEIQLVDYSSQLIFLAMTFSDPKKQQVAKTAS